MLYPETRGYVVTDWASVGPSNLLGVTPSDALPAMPGSSLSSATRSMNDAGARPWHPDSPLFWFGAFMAVTLGLIGASTSVRVGPFRAGVNAGKT